MISTACELAKEQGVSSVRFEVENVYDFDFDGDFFHAAYSNGVLEYLRNPRDALEEVWRMLKPGGIIGARSGDPFMGRNLRALLNKVDYENTQFS